MNWNKRRTEVAVIALLLVVPSFLVWGAVDMAYSDKAEDERTLQPGEWLAIEFRARTRGMLEVDTENTLNQAEYLVILVNADD